MGARSSGIFPREGFNLDNECEITSSATAANVTLANAKTIRIIAIGKGGTYDNAGTNKLTVTVGGQAIDFDLRDFDANGVGIAHIRGALCDIDNNVSYTQGGTATITKVFYELVDGPRR